MSQFDPQTFAQLTFNEANSTESVPVPVGEYPATVKDYKILQWAAKDNSSSGLKMNVFWEVSDPEVTRVTEREKSIVRQEMMFDLIEQTGSLDMGKGKNVKLGRLRDALGLNTPGEDFSFDMMVGRSGLIVVGHRPDQRDSSILYAEVKDVARL